MYNVETRISDTLLYWLILSQFAAQMGYIVYKHWPDTCEFITWTIELWNRWNRLSWYYNRV